MTDSYSKTDGDAFDYGYSLFVLKDSELDGTKSTEGIFRNIILTFGLILKEIYLVYS